MNKSTVSSLKKYFAQEPAVELAFLFGSSATSREMEESDVDIAVYLKDRKKEDAVWRKVQQAVPREIDLVPLNDAPAAVISNVFKTGIPLSIKNKRLYWRLYLEKSLEAEDFSEFARSYWNISQRAQSLSPEDQTRLLERLDFLKAEMQELPAMRTITQREYEENKTKRRNIERWAENIINALIDIAKIILASEKKEMPRTYESALSDFGAFAGFPPAQVEKLSRLARLRNILAHEYLDILYGKIQEFTDDIPAIYRKVLAFSGKQGKGHK